MNRPLVLLDCDGVLADFTGGYLRLIKEVTGRDYTHGHVDQWEIVQALGLSKGEAAAVNALVDRPGFCYNLTVLDGAKEGVQLLREVADVHVVTWPWPGRHWAGERLEWLHDALGVDRHDVTLTHRKELIPSHVMVDDRLRNVRNWHERWHNVGVLWDTHHNATEDVPPPLVRVGSWAELVHFVRGVSVCLNLP